MASTWGSDDAAHPRGSPNPSGRIELAAEVIMADIPRLRESVDAPTDGLLLIGRRHLRSNNSWMHNLPALAGGTNRCTLLIHPDDAATRHHRDRRRRRPNGGKLEVPVEITDAIRPGVVSLPHGWGHDAPGTRLSVAATQPG